ncbi:MAG: hypothetical protein ACXVDZ_17000 [Bacteroidia bacterium]
MQNFVITYNIDNAADRQQFVDDFETVLVGFGFHKEHTNQSTYYGTYRDKQSLATDLYNATTRLVWSANDIVTIYYPKVTKGPGDRNFPDLGRHGFKVAGNIIRNHNIINI